MNIDVLELTAELVKYESISRATNVPVTRHLAKVLRALGFKVEMLPYTDAAGVAKLTIVARLGRAEKGGLSLMSHDDVVPAGSADDWSGNPFQVREHGGKLYGRGACDMKGPLAASICAACRFTAGDLRQPLYIVVTSDEEINALGAREVVDRSKLFADLRHGYGVICEPTRLQVVHAHKGSLGLTITSKGRAAHTSSLKGVNANLKMIPFLNEMRKVNESVLTSRRYRNDEFKPPHSEWSIGINDNNVATNVSPAQSVCTVNYRPMPGTDTNALVRRTRKCASDLGLKCVVHRTGSPLYTPKDAPIVRTSLALAGRRTPTTVAYGTDGLAYSEQMKQLVVLGPGDIAQAHTVDEWIEVDQLHKGVELYTRFIDHVCVQGLA